MTDIAACLCFKDSGIYLDEWLLFHYAQGIRKFFLYDNGSTDSWREDIDHWLKLDIVEAVHWPGSVAQMSAYNDCIHRARGQVKWLAFLDDDEFLFSSNGTKLGKSLEYYDDFAGVAVSWVLYGTNAHESYNPEWVIERFTRSTGAGTNTCKCVVRPERVSESLVVGHHFQAINGFSIVDQNKAPYSVEEMPALIDPMRINHYMMRSWQEFLQRRSRPRADNGEIIAINEADWRDIDKNLSAVEDMSALNSLEELRELRTRLFD